jgi:predicted secreted protein
MGAINGTTLLLYSAGQAIAMQKGLTISFDVDLPDATNKESAGWAEHITGLMNAKIDFNSLFSTGLMTDTPAVLSAKDLMDYILNKTSLLIAILGGPFPIVGQCDMNSLSFTAPLEQAMTLAGSLKVNGKLYPLTGGMVQLITDPGGISSSYDTFTTSGTAITSAITASTDNCHSNSFSVSIGDVFKFITFLTLNSGQIPTVELNEVGGGAALISNVSQLVAGLNIATLTATATKTGSMIIQNTSAANWKTTPIYLFKV